MSGDIKNYRQNRSLAKPMKQDNLQYWDISSAVTCRAAEDK